MPPVGIYNLILYCRLEARQLVTVLAVSSRLRWGMGTVPDADGNCSD